MKPSSGFIYVNDKKTRVYSDINKVKNLLKLIFRIIAQLKLNFKIVLFILKNLQ